MYTTLKYRQAHTNEIQHYAQIYYSAVPTISYLGDGSCTPPLVPHKLQQLSCDGKCFNCPTSFFPPPKGVTFWGNTQLPFAMGYESNFVYENVISGKLKNFHL